MVANPGGRLLLLLLCSLLASLLLSSSVSATQQQQRGWTTSTPTSAAAFLPPSSSPSSNPPQPPQQALPLSRRHGRSNRNQRSPTQTSPSPLGRRHALPPFDTPLDPATIEAMVKQAGDAAVAGASAQSTLGPPGEVTTEQLWVGFVAGVFPFVWAGVEFWKRIDTQQRCGVCLGSGLVYESKTGRPLEVPRKCYACGGFLPWMGWRRFWLSNLDIGNGGILQRPAPDYEQLSAEAKARRAASEGQGQEGKGQGKE